MTEKDEQIRAALYELLEAHGYAAAASVLYSERAGVVCIPSELVNTNDGREEAVSLFQEAMQDNIAVIIFQNQIGPISEIVREFYPKVARTQGYA